MLNTSTFYQRDFFQKWASKAAVKNSSKKFLSIMVRNQKVNMTIRLKFLQPDEEDFIIFRNMSEPYLNSTKLE